MTLNAQYDFRIFTHFVVTYKTENICMSESCFRYSGPYSVLVEKFPERLE